jgi:hypothetical protein
MARTSALAKKEEEDRPRKSLISQRIERKSAPVQTGPPRKYTKTHQISRKSKPVWTGVTIKPHEIYFRKL